MAKCHVENNLFFFSGLDACEGTGVSTSPLILEEHMLEELDGITDDKHNRLNLSRGMNG